MKTTINLNKIHHLPNGQDSNGYCDSFASVEEARRAAEEFLAERENYTCEIVRVCDDVEDDRYCEIVEVIETVCKEEE